MMTATEKNATGGLVGFLKSLIPWLIGGFVFGVLFSLSRKVFGWDLGTLLSADTLDASGSFALCLGALLFVTGCVSGIGALSAKVGVKLNFYAEEADWQEGRMLYVYSSLGCIAWGVILIMLALAGPLALADSSILLTLLTAMCLLLAFTFWRLLFVFDELWHDINRISCEFAFYGALLIGGGWSALAHLGFVEPLSPLGWISLLTGLSLVGATIGNAKRGMLNQ